MKFCGSEPFPKIMVDSKEDGQVIDFFPLYIVCQCFTPE